MVDHPTVSVDATQAGTWVHTFHVLTSLVGWTFWIGCTLWSTGYVGISKVFRNTLTGSSSVPVLANCIGSTRGGVAGVNNFYRSRQSGDPLAGNERIPCVSRVTFTERKMVGDGTGGVGSTHPRTRIHTVLVDTGLVPGTLCVDGALRLTFNVRISDVVPYTGT